MIVVPPIPSRFRRTRLQAAEAPHAILVNVVQTNEPPEEGQCIWVFTEAVNVTALPTGLRVKVGGVWKQPNGMEGVTNPTTTIVLYYPTAETLDGKDWSIVATPTGITEASQIVVPQNGVIIAP